MTELITNRITASVVQMPEEWRRFDVSEKGIETAVVHAINEGGGEVLVGDIFFILKEQPLEYQCFPHLAIVEVNIFTTKNVTRYYVSLTQVPF